ncbi:MAG: RimK family alpha-L-glutamate ligase [Candidatus Eremiobacteraeota bacterium]|nr:RimK family alpha-L-glutamate ligase [Candidatus Eremiobacteraeota bacterium]
MRIAFFAKDCSSYTVKRLAEEAVMEGHEVACHNPLQVAIGPDSLLSGGARLSGCDMAFVRTSVHAAEREFILAVARHLELGGVPVINPPGAIERSSNKFTTFQVLKGIGVPVVPSVALRSGEEAGAVIEALGGFPLVVKLFYGSRGMGVTYATSQDMLVSLIDSYRALGVNVLVSPFLGEPRGRCLRVLCAGGEVIAAVHMASKPGDFRSNAARGGVIAGKEETEQCGGLAMRALSSLGLLAGSADLLADRGRLMVLEVNSSPGIESLERALGCSIAGPMLKALIEALARDGRLPGGR